MLPPSLWGNPWCGHCSWRTGRPWFGNRRRRVRRRCWSWEGPWSHRPCRVQCPEGSIVGIQRKKKEKGWWWGFWRHCLNGKEGGGRRRERWGFWRRCLNGLCTTLKVIARAFFVFKITTIFLLKPVINFIRYNILRWFSIIVLECAS